MHSLEGNSINRHEKDTGRSWDWSRWASRAPKPRERMLGKQLLLRPLSASLPTQEHRVERLTQGSCSPDQRRGCARLHPQDGEQASTHLQMSMLA